MVLSHPGWMSEYGGGICKLQCLSKCQANHKKKSSGPEEVIESSGDLGKAESMSQSRGENTLVNIDR